MIRKFISCNLIAVFLTATITSALSDINHCQRDGYKFNIGDIYTINGCYMCTCVGSDVFSCDGRNCSFSGKQYCMIGGIRLLNGTSVMIGCDCKCLGDNILSCTFAPCSRPYYIGIG